MAVEESADAGIGAVLQENMLRSEVIVCFVNIGRIVDHHCLEVIVCFVKIGRFVDHHCLEVILCFVNIDEIVDNHCLNFLFGIS